MSSLIYIRYKAIALPYYLSFPSKKHYKLRNSNILNTSSRTHSYIEHHIRFDITQIFITPRAPRNNKEKVCHSITPQTRSKIRHHSKQPYTHPPYILICRSTLCYTQPYQFALYIYIFASEEPISLCIIHPVVYIYISTNKVYVCDRCSR